MQIAGKRSVDAIHQIQAIVGRHPKASRPVLIRHADIVVAQTSGIPGVMQIANKCVVLGIEAIQSARRGEPQIAFLILEDVVHVIVAQTGRDHWGCFYTL